MHWDHIQGFPFFGPFFHPAGRFEFWATPRSGANMHDVIARQMTQPTFPVGLDIIPSQLTFKDIPLQGEAQLGELTIRWCELCHSPGNTAYRFDYRGRSIVFSGDVEVQRGSRKELVQLAQGADVLIMDAQYFPEEYKSRVGFGHSTPLDAVSVAKEAGVLHLLLTHHDPTHTDQKLDQKLSIAQKAANGEIAVENARDQLQMSFSSKSMSTSHQPDLLSLRT
jgi:phosphoribosyl 1,2-cyclic phosphodiesterase